MSLEPKTTKQISDNIVAQIESSTSQTVPLLPKAFTRVIAKAVAGVFTLLYKYCGFIFLQMFVRYASAKPVTVNGQTFVPLTEWGRLVGVGDPDAATSAELTIEITVTNQTGSLPVYTQFVGPDNGVTYVTLSPVNLNAPTVQVNVRASSDQTGGGGAGAIGNLDPGDIVSLANPISNVSRDAVVVSQVVTGANAETTTNYRNKIIDRMQRRPQGGAYVDYGEWGIEPEGILNIYPYTGDPGEVDVYVEATVASSGNPDGIPTGAQLTAVYDSIQFDDDGLASRRPANAYVNVYPITRTGFDIDVNGVTGIPGASQAQAEIDINAALNQYMAAREPYIPGYTIGSNNNRILNNEVSGIVNAIIVSYGGVFSNTVLKRLGTPIVIYELNEGEKAKATSINVEFS